MLAGVRRLFKDERWRLRGYRNCDQVIWTKISHVAEASPFANWQHSFHVVTVLRLFLVLCLVWVSGCLPWKLFRSLSTDSFVDIPGALNFHVFWDPVSLF